MVRDGIDFAVRIGELNDSSLVARVSRFSLDALVNIATALGRRVSLAFEAA